MKPTATQQFHQPLEVDVVVSSTENRQPEHADSSEPEVSTADLAFHLTQYGFAGKQAWRLCKSESADQTNQTHRGDQ